MPGAEGQPGAKGTAGPVGAHGKPGQAGANGPPVSQTDKCLSILMIEASSNAGEL